MLPAGWASGDCPNTPAAVSKVRMRGEATIRSTCMLEAMRGLRGSDVRLCAATRRNKHAVTYTVQH